MAAALGLDGRRKRKRIRKLQPGLNPYRSRALRQVGVHAHDLDAQLREHLADTVFDAGANRPDEDLRIVDRAEHPTSAGYERFTHALDSGGVMSVVAIEKADENVAVEND
ncbi:hypothetical protein OJ997_19125 [Solirubrobacter phytolaccae]|uniref:Uncharacterized protein n=1 Tax=Solirubrobacter phytolaccae TaxID=1404360 RepID=A0A9X3NA98_9ACTN|nr:hypothetical protein [Solirubrobacter phytolaccae]MDA0182429.1 hypothetical protein [Solirubrobacter phytolaccae]